MYAALLCLKFEFKFKNGDYSNGENLWKKNGEKWEKEEN